MAGLDDDVSLASNVKHTVQAGLYDSWFTMAGPTALLVFAACALVYNQVQDMAVSGFSSSFTSIMLIIFLQTLPVMALKLRIYRARDRMNLASQVLVKTMFMHVVMLATRIAGSFVAEYTLYEVHDKIDVVFITFAVAIVYKSFNFPPSVPDLMSHVDVGICIAGAFGMAWVIFTLHGMDMVPQRVLFTTANYLDVVAFVPASWRLYRAERYETPNAGFIVPASVKEQVQRFFMFTATFYLYEDLGYPYAIAPDYTNLALAFHALHFFLILDFAGFFMFEVSKASGDGQRSGYSLEDVEQSEGLLANEGAEF